MQIKYIAIADHQQKKMTKFIEMLVKQATSAEELKEKIETRFSIAFKQLTLNLTVEEVKNGDELDFIVTVNGKPIK